MTNKPSAEYQKAIMREDEGEDAMDTAYGAACAILDVINSQPRTPEPAVFANIILKEMLDLLARAHKRRQAREAQSAKPASCDCVPLDAWGQTAFGYPFGALAVTKTGG